MQIEQLVPGQTVRHFKGGIYYIIGVGYDSEAPQDEGVDRSRLIVAYYSVAKNRLNFRPCRRQDCRTGEKAFLETVEHQGNIVQRFKPIDGEAPNFLKMLSDAYGQIIQDLHLKGELQK